MKESDIELKIAELSKKYFMTQNMELRSQISLMIDTYRTELEIHKQAMWDQINQNRNKGLDKLINID